jgi:hypothetical protein
MHSVEELKQTKRFPFDSGSLSVFGYDMHVIVPFLSVYRVPFGSIVTRAMAYPGLYKLICPMSAQAPNRDRVVLYFQRWKDGRIVIGSISVKTISERQDRWSLIG